LLSNRSGGDWNWEALQEFPPDLLMDLGFDESDLSRIWDETLEIIDDPFNEEKEIKKAKSTTIKIGDMFALGEHRIICGNSEDPEVIKKLLGDKKVDAVNSDIPFNLGLSYNRGMGHKKSYGGNINDKKTDSEYRDFVSKLMANALSVSKPNCHWAIWSDERYNGMIQDLYKEHGIAFKRTCLWVKPAMNPTPKVAFNKCVEYCTYGVTGLPYICDKIKNLNEIMNKDIGTGVRQTSDIIDLFNIWLVNRVPGQEMEHPTQKPPSLYEKFLKRTTRPGDAILDMTSGSGSLLLGCQQLGRKAFLCDITPTFIQLTIQRYEKLTGKKAEQIG